MVCAVAQYEDPRAKLILSALQRHGLSMRWLAAKLNLQPRQVTRWLNGEQAPRNRAVYNDMIEAVKSYESSTDVSSEVSLKRVGIRTIPLYTGISAGHPSALSGDVEMLEVKDWKNDRERWARTVSGNSMSPLLESGDIVIIEDRPYESGHVVHAYDDGEDTIKVARGFGSNAKLIPINIEYPILEAIGWNIKGVVVGVIRNLPRGAQMTLDYPHGLYESHNLADS